MSARVLCLWMPNWPIQCQVMRDSSWAGQAVAVHAATARKGRRIVASSDAAVRRGLQAGMPLSEASLIRRRSTAPLHLAPHDPAEDLSRLATLAEHCERFSPLTGWRTTEDTNMSPETGPDCLLLDVLNLGDHFGGESELMRRACDSLGRRGIFTCAAMADTIGAAWAAAHFNPQGQLADLHKPGSALPSHRWLIPSGQANEALTSLPPAALRLPPSTLETLHQLGIVSIDQLLELPRAAIATRLGDEPMKRWDQALGAAAEEILAYRPPATFFVARRFDAPVRDRRAIEHVVGELAVELAEKLREAQRGAVQLDCRLDSLQGQTTCLTIGLFEPSLDPEHLDELLRLQLETAQLENGVERIAITAPQVESLAERQGDLFGQNKNLRAAAHLVDRLRQRLGTQQVLQPQLRADSQPERAVAYTTRPVSTRTRRSRRKAKSTEATPNAKLDKTLPLHRPLALGEPKELVVFSWNGVVPREFSWNGKLVEVLRFWGPERIETGWWRGQSVRRDYYRVELRGGERLWMFCQMNTKHWYLHGWHC